MLRSIALRNFVPALSAASLLACFASFGCGAADETLETDSIESADGVEPATASDALRRRLRAQARSNQRPRLPPITGSAGATSTPTPPPDPPAPTPDPPAPTPDPPAPTPGTPAPTPGTGSGDAPTASGAFVNGGVCPFNRPMAGACGPYGLNCTYVAASATHYCICLSAAASGVQGWSCR